MTLELIFGVVQALVTAILASFTKNKKVPKKYIPYQNIAVGLLAGILANYFNLYNDVVMAMFVCLSISTGVGGIYDATQTKIKK